MFDSLAIAAIAEELRALLGARVQQVAQIDALSLGLELYRAGERRWLFASAEPGHSGAWLVGDRLGGSRDVTSPILLLLRKHARGQRLEAVDQPPFERVLRCRFSDCALIVEATGRLANVILVDESGTILDAIKRVPPSINRQRTILPRRPYVGPPPQQKASPFDADAHLMAEALAGFDGSAERALVAAVRGISPLAARECVHRAGAPRDAPAAAVDPARLADALAEVVAPLRGTTGATWQPSIGLADQSITAFAPYALTHLPRHELVASFSRAVERFVGTQTTRSPLAQAQVQLRGELDARRAREARRLGALERELGDSAEADALREAGELLLAYQSQLAPATAVAELAGRQIELDPTLSPLENAQRYFERYARRRDARRRLPEMIEQARARLAYLDEMLVHLELAGATDDVAALRRDLQHDETPEPPSGPQKRDRRKGAKANRGPGKRAASPARAGPMRVRLGDQVAFVGRSARQNEEALELARPSDLWLHARGVAGSHVILRVDGQRPPEAAIEAAASLAAYYSGARAEARVIVDVAERRHVRRQKGGPPGAVTYTNERTLTVPPVAPPANRAAGA